MATAATAPAPLRAADSSTSPDLQHPTPDLQSLQGAYVGNIERLEEHAERMSEKGSDLGEEIRKLQLEQKLSDSRRSSLLSASVAEEPIRLVGTRSRGASTGSFTNSIVDVNGAARWGGFSPGGYLPSPTGSLRSSSSQPVALQRQRSNSKASRLDQITRVDEEETIMERIEEHHEHPRSPRLPREPTHEPSPPLTRPRSVSSFTQKYDEMANQLQQDLRNSVILASGYEQQQQDRDQRASYYDHPDHPDLPDRPPTAASTDTTHKLRTLWQDFDGTHCPDTVPEDEPLPAPGNGTRDSSMLKSAPDLPPQGAPPPGDSMVYYPAPVPRMLNLPQRLSKVPNLGIQAKRRTQLLDSMQTENRKSAPWLSDMGQESSSPKATRKSRNLANLPPTLRASVFFDAPAAPQQFEVKGESAQDTLENILAASAHAPVSAFTDHPYAGHVGDEIYGQEKKHKRTGSKANELEKIESRKSRSSLHLLDTRRNSSGDPLNKLKKRNSSADLNMLTVRAAESRMSLGDELDHNDLDARGPDQHNEHAVHSDDGDHEHAVYDEEEFEPEDQPEEQFFGAPTTLLAELQMRKAQQKTRNLTAATAFPNGMHSTLLELDAVAEVEKQKRLKKKVNLAWEAQAPQDEDASSDDDVPLGMLFPGREKATNTRQNAAVKDDWDRPLGLIAQREIENNEPLSARRSRLLGGNRNTRLMDSAKRNTQFTEFNSPSQPHLAVQDSAAPQAESEEEEEGETLAQRLRRLKNEKALDEAIVDIRKSTISADFSTELMGQFGVNEEDKSKAVEPPANDGEEETLGQRRARLQVEALARGDANPHGSRPPLRASMSMADVLGAHPIDPNNSARKVSDEQLLSSLPAGSLLHQNAVKQERRRVSRMDMNRRGSSYNLEQPLLGEGVGKVSEDQPIGAKIQAYKDKLAGTSVATPRTAPALGNPMLNPSRSSVNLLGGQRDSYFPQAQPMPMMGVNGMSGYGMMPQQMMGMQMGMMAPPMMGMPGMAYPQMGMPGMRQSSMISLPQMGMMGGMQPGMGMQQNMGTVMVEPPMDPRQRDAIDRWRSAVMH